MSPDLVRGQLFAALLGQSNGRQGRLSARGPPPWSQGLGGVGAGRFLFLVRFSHPSAFLHGEKDMMTRAVLAVFVLLIAPICALAQSLPKEGSGTTTIYFTGTVKMLAAGQDLAAITYDVLGVWANDAGQGFLHNASSRCVGGLSVVKGEFDNEQGVCVTVDSDGDQAFFRYTGAGRAGATAKVKGSFIGGTGKYTGLTGTYEGTRTQLRPTMQGTTHSVSKGSFAYKLP